MDICLSKVCVVLKLQQGHFIIGRQSEHWLIAQGAGTISPSSRNPRGQRIRDEIGCRTDSQLPDRQRLAVQAVRGPSGLLAPGLTLAESTEWGAGGAPHAGWWRRIRLADVMAVAPGVAPPVGKGQDIFLQKDPNGLVPQTIRQATIPTCDKTLQPDRQAWRDNSGWAY